jgi:hypothetical protein
VRDIVNTVAITAIQAATSPITSTLPRESRAQPT